MNIFEHMMDAMKKVNDNIITLSENMNDIHTKVDELHKMFADISEPESPGAEADVTNTIGGQTY